MEFTAMVRSGEIHT